MENKPVVVGDVRAKVRIGEGEEADQFGIWGSGFKTVIQEGHYTGVTRFSIGYQKRLDIQKNCGTNRHIYILAYLHIKGVHVMQASSLKTEGVI